MSGRRIISNTFTVNTVEDGEVYEILTSIDSITIPANQTSVSTTIGADFYIKRGTAERQAFTSYYAVYFRTGTSFLRITSGNASSFSNLTVSPLSTMSAISIYLFSANYIGLEPDKQNYITKKEIIVVKQGDNGNTGPRGKMSRNIYYAGTLAEVTALSTFEATDYKAPYVRVSGTAEVPVCYVYVGDNGTSISFPTTTTAYEESTDWEEMTTEFKYLITNAIFADFAKFGSAVISGDYMISQYGYILGFGGTRNEITNGTQYQNIDPNDVFGEGDMYDSDELIWNDTTTHNVSVTTPTALKSTGLTAGKYYTIELDENTGLTECVLQISLKSTSTTAGALNIPTSQSGKKYYANFKCNITGNYTLYVSVAASGQQASFNGLFLRQAKFVPYYILDMLQGKIVLNNIIARGRLHADSLYNKVISTSSNNDYLTITDESIITLSFSTVNTKIMLPAPDISKGRVIEIFSGLEDGYVWKLSYVGGSNKYFKNPCGSSSDYKGANFQSWTETYVKLWCDGADWYVLKAEKTVMDSSNRFMIQLLTKDSTN